MNKIIAKIRSSKRLQYILGGILGVLILGSIILYLRTNNRVQIDDSLVSAPLITVTSTTTGTLQQLNVVEGQKVKKGDTLAVVGSETIHANTDGIVVTTNRQIGGTVSPQTTLIQMINPNSLRVDGTLDENKGLSQIKVGQVVSFTVDALGGQTFWGYVDEVSPTAKQTQVAFSISSERPTQQFDVYAKFDSSAYSQIKNGMSAKMTVYTKN